MAGEQRALNTAPIVDEDGFLLQPETWTKGIARELAGGDMPGGLSRDHWKVIDCVRQYYLEFGTIPPVRLVVHSTAFSLRRIHELFPQGYAKGVCKAAGIPQHTIRVAPMPHVHRS